MSNFDLFNSGGAAIAAVLKDLSKGFIRDTKSTQNK